MARAARRQAESEIYHVMVRGVGRQVIFEDDVDRRFYLSSLREELVSHGGELLSWCLMDNHVHLLVRIAFEGLSSMMQTVGSEYATFFNRRHERVGHLFQDRFKSEPVDSESYLLTVVRYIHMNPVKDGLCTTPEYQWSSYRAYLGYPEQCALTSCDFVLGLLGGVEGFVRFHLQETGEKPDLEMGASTRFMSVEQLKRIAEEALGGTRVEDVASLPRPQRNDAIRRMRAARLSVRQIERLTGVSRGVIARLKA